MATAQLRRQPWVYFRKAARVAWTRVALLFYRVHKATETRNALARRAYKPSQVDLTADASTKPDAARA